MNNPIVLHCENLSKTFREGKWQVEVLKKINLTLHVGEMIAIVGSSGSGKSTLLHLLGGLDKPTAGQVLVAGENIHQLSERDQGQWRNQHLGFVYQFHHLLPEFTLLENVCMPLLIRGQAPASAYQQAKHLLEKVGLTHRLQHKLSELSGGERQRAAIVRALINKPVCVLADEPTGNLDQKTAEKVFATFVELNQALNTSLIIVTHDMQIAKRMNRILHLDDGCLKA